MLVGVMLVLVTLMSAATAQDSADTPDSYSLLPLSSGVELRAHAQVLQYDAAGRIVSRAEERSGPIDLGRLRASGRWVHALPAQDGFEPLVLTTRVDALGEASRYCERITLEDGRRVTRIAALPPPGIELNQAGPTWPPPLPGGGLARVDGLWDDAYLRGAAARDRLGMVYALALRFGDIASYSMVSLAQDCEPQAQVPNPRAFDAHPGHAGVYAVAGGPYGSSAVWLLRQVNGEQLWSIGFTHLMNQPAGPDAQYWVLALDDGGVVVAGAGRAPQDSRVQLLRFNAEGELLARGEVDGTHIATMRQSGARLILALAEPVQTGAWPQSGASDLVELGLDFAQFARLRLPQAYVHGPVNSAPSGLRSDTWLVASTAADVFAGEYEEPIRWGALRVQPGLQLEWLQPMSADRPRMLLADGDLLASRRIDASTQLVRLRAAGGEQPFEAPSMRPKAEFNIVGSLVLADGAVARLRHRGRDLFLDVHEADALAWSQRVGGWVGSDVRRLFSGGPDAAICLIAVVGSAPASIEVRCHARESGEALPVRAWASSEPLIASPLGLLDASGRPALYAVTAAHDGFLLREWGLAPGMAGESVPSVRDIEISPVQHCAMRAFELHPESGSAVLERIGGRFRLQRFGSDRELLWQTPVPDDWLCPGVLSVSESGEVLLGKLDPSVPGSSPTELLGIAVDGRVLWQVPARSAIGPGAENARVFEREMRWFKPPTSEFWVSNVWVDERAALAVFSASTGEQRMLLRSVREWPDSSGWAFDATGNDSEIILFERDVEWVRSRRLDLASGRLGPSLELRTPWFSESQQVVTVGDRMEAAQFRPDSAEVISHRTLPALPLAADRAVGSEHNGQWYDPQITGQGLFLDVEPGTQRWFGSWFTYMDEEEAGSFTDSGLRRRLRWYSMLGQGSATSGLPIAGTLYSTSGGRFEGGAPQTSEVGQAFLRAIDCNTLEFAYSIPDANDASAPVLTGSRRLQRLGPAPASCGGASLAEQSGLRGASAGSWVLEGRPNQGVLMQVDPGAAGQPGAVWGAWFGFDAGEPDDELAQHWLTVIGRSAAGQPGVVELEWMRTLGGSFDAQPTRNTRVIGSGRLRFTACDRAVLEYSFDAPGLPGDAFAGLQGQVNLRRFDRCD